MSDILPLADSEYLDFQEIPRPEQKTTTWAVRSKRSGDQLGRIKWYGPWRQYCFFPEGNTIWNVGCLGDIQNFIDHQMALRKRART